jgi:uncharacterized protein YuzE
MKVKYDADVDVITVIFSEAKVAESDENKPGVIIDYDKKGNIISLEILDASKRTKNPRTLEHIVNE